MWQRGCERTKRRAVLSYNRRRFRSPPARCQHPPRTHRARSFARELLRRSPDSSDSKLTQVLAQLVEAFIQGSELGMLVRLRECLDGALVLVLFQSRSFAGANGVCLTHQCRVLAGAAILKRTHRIGGELVLGVVVVLIEPTILDFPFYRPGVIQRANAWRQLCNDGLLLLVVTL